MEEVIEDMEIPIFKEFLDAIPISLDDGLVIYVDLNYLDTSPINQMVSGVYPGIELELKRNDNQRGQVVLLVQNPSREKILDIYKKSSWRVTRDEGEIRRALADNPQLEKILASKCAVKLEPETTLLNLQTVAWTVSPFGPIDHTIELDPFGVDVKFYRTPKLLELPSYIHKLQELERKYPHRLSLNM